MFTNGGILGAAGNAGGGGGGNPGEYGSATLIAAFYDAGTNYNGTSHVWTASNNGDYQLVDAGSNDPVGVDGNNRLEFGSSDELDMNAALKAAINGLDDITLVCASYNPSGATTRLQVRDGAANQANLDRYSTSVAASHTRASTGGEARETVADPQTFYALKGEFPRGAISTVQRGSNTEVNGTPAAGDEAIIADAGSSDVRIASFGGTCHVGFILIYDGILSADDWTSLLSDFSDNAEFGSSGVDLT